MIALAPRVTDALDPDQAAALARLGDDLRSVSGPTVDLAVRERIVAYAHVALARAAGAPHDSAWDDLAREVSAFVRRHAAAERRPSPALLRLRRLVEDELAAC